MRVAEEMMVQWSDSEGAEEFLNARQRRKAEKKAKRAAMLAGVTYAGQTLSLKDWWKSKENVSELSWPAFKRRVLDLGWSLEDALTVSRQRDQAYEAFGEARTLKEWAKDRRCKVRLSCLRGRMEMTANGYYVEWTMEDALTILPHQRKLEKRRRR